MRILTGVMAGLLALVLTGCETTGGAEASAADTAATPVAEAVPAYTSIGDPAAFDAGKPTVFITGANRGIGLEFVRQFSERGWNIIATARTPDAADDLRALQQGYPRLVIEEFDVTDMIRLEQLSTKYADTPFDLLLGNAGITPRYASAFRRLDGMDWQMAKDSFDVNALAPLQLAQAFFSNVVAAPNGKIVIISSKAGSFELSPKMPMMYSYRASKAALNMFMYTLSFETQRAGRPLVLLSPGQVNTTPASEMGGFRMPDAIEPEESVSKMLAVIEAVTMEQNGKFLDYEDGAELAW